MIIKPQIWLAMIGDLVAVGTLSIVAPRVRQNSSYRIVINHSSIYEKCAILVEGRICWFDNIVLMPLWSINGSWLQVGKSEI